MTTKHDSVLSESDKKEIKEKYIRGFINQNPFNLIEMTEQATLAKLQPQLDAIGAGGVSGQRVMQTRTPEGYKLVPIEPTQGMLDNVDEKVGGSCYACSTWDASEDDCRRVYAAMLAAAPTPSTE